ncbi:ATP-dependent zinc protease [Thiomicrorhabdus sp. ZW0627]|uniref:ATP-dependent zinc protease family protein n=1 Tax=Thiomicrorhabdus sp. ZW0627 TaxID=3039774 RepID=UPI0024364678|nr:ATP-dependent zinc protease [Thiomicrorhabdus sp. ZW0627]MDG6773047.1 ATP-dependent zinc protease [Thiomicrorhabdus sp. ZW0627]
MSEMVGWREWVSLPELGIQRLKCKVDTGAKNSALHAFGLEPFDKDGMQWIRFSIHTDEQDLSQIQICEAKVNDIRAVTDSSGNVSERYFIRTRIQIGEHRLKISVSLTSRDTMTYKMLLGRTALRKAGLLVNPTKSFMQGSE